MTAWVDAKPTAKLVTPWVGDVDGEPIMVVEADYQRNGVAGEGFYVLRFAYEERVLTGVLFGYVANTGEIQEYGYCAVVDPSDLTVHWRGDHFAPVLRRCLTERYDELWRKDF